MNNLYLPTASRTQFPIVPMWNYGDTSEESMVDDQSPIETPIAHINFLEANTDSITIDEHANDCIVPTWGSQELTIAHQDFISTVHAAARNYFLGETLNEPSIRVSHEVKGRIPSALNKRPSELLPSDKAKFYQRLAFAFTIPSIHENINGQEMQLCIKQSRTRTINQSLAVLGEKIGLPFKLHIHCARHSFGTNGLNNGGDIKVISTLMGHSSALTTEKVYASVLPETLQKVVDKSLNFQIYNIDLQYFERHLPENG